MPSTPERMLVAKTVTRIMAEIIISGQNAALQVMKKAIQRNMILSKLE
jgi:hypothetical protein